MLKLWGVIILMLAAAFPAWGTEFRNKDIESITVLADSRLAVPLSQLATMFTHKNMISVANIFAVSAEQKKKIESSESLDVFITGDHELVQQLKTRKRIDVHSIDKDITMSESVRFAAALFTGANIKPAREFLEYLQSPEAQAVFRRNGLRTP